MKVLVASATGYLGRFRPGIQTAGALDPRPGAESRKIWHPHVGRVFSGAEPSPARTVTA